MGKKMPILARFTNFCDFYDFRNTVATAFLGISKVPTVDVEIHSFSFYLFSMCLAKLYLGYKLKDFLAMLGEVKVVWKDSLGNAFL